VDELGKRTAVQHDTLLRGRQDLDALRQQIHDFHKAYADIGQLRDKLGADRAALETFSERMTAFMARTPQLDATLNAINEKLALVDEGVKQTTRLGELTAHLDAQAAQVSSRMQLVEKLQARVDALHTSASDVDGKLADQLARRAELDTLKSQCEAVLAQALDAQQKVDAVAERQKEVLPLAARLTTLDAQLQASEARVKTIALDEAAVREQQARLTESLETSRTLASEANERMKQTQALNEQLGRAAAVKEELISELARIQAHVRDAAAHTSAVEDQLKRTETLSKQLEQRRTQIAFSEKKIAGVETKVTELLLRAAGLDTLIKHITDRETVVSAVKAQVDGVHQVGATSKADLQFVADQRQEVAKARTEI
jgi:chromosome segregation ATPase